MNEQSQQPVTEEAATEQPLAVEAAIEGAATDEPPVEEPRLDAPPEPGPEAAHAAPDAAPEPAGAEDQLTLALRERDDYLDALRRMQADFENYKKRVAKQQAEVSARAAEMLVDRLLPAIDVADLAVAHGASEDTKQVWTALLDALEREGLERIDPAGGEFDPTRHDAVAHEAAGDGAAQEVVEVMRAGYAWKGRVLRPAMVKVRG